LLWDIGVSKLGSPGRAALFAIIAANSSGAWACRSFPFIIFKAQKLFNRQKSAVSAK
jgi:hypothetical protein